MPLDYPRSPPWRYPPANFASALVFFVIGTAGWTVMTGCTLTACTCATTPDDSEEENDTCGTASGVGVNSVNYNLNVSKTDPDSYTITVQPGRTLDIDTYFGHVFGDIDIYLYLPGPGCGNPGNAVASGFSVSDHEHMTWTNNGAAAQKVILEVQVWAGSTQNCNSYVLDVDDGSGGNVGMSYCGPAVPNSSGQGAIIMATGSPFAGDNDLQLFVQDLPVETWHFQCWYRDLNPTATSNFTDAVSVLFM